MDYQVKDLLKVQNDPRVFLVDAGPIKRVQR